MCLLLLFALLAFPASTLAYLEEPPTSADPTTPADCSNWYVAKAGDTGRCKDLSGTFGISEYDLVNTYNPSVGPKCQLHVAQSYCIERNWGIPPAMPTTPTSTTPVQTTATASGGNGIETPQPTQPGLTPNCAKFYFAKEGQGCGELLAENNIRLEDFFAWNSGVGSKCQNMWGDTYHCVAVVGASSRDASTPPAVRATPTSAGNGIETPAPTQPGISPNCAKFYKVGEGESCSAVLSKNGISLADFYAWNTGVGKNCQSMWGDTYHCIGIIGGLASGVKPTPTTPSGPATTKTGNGISTPIPIQPGMTPNCDKFYKVAEGESCSDVLQKHGITMSQFYMWNTGVGSNCQNMWANTYHCVQAF